MNSIISLKNVKKIYNMGNNDVRALDGINLDIKKSEFIAIVGASGSGKSTMMNIVGCLDYPSYGNVYLDGINTSEMDESTLAKIRGRKIGFVFQQFNLIPVLNAVENVAMPLIFQNVNKSEREKKAKELLDKVGLGDRMMHRPNELSGGQRQRVAIARALVSNPEVILADEPTGNLDSKTGKEVMDLLYNINKEHGKTVILVTHDLDLVKHAERIVYLKDGKIEKIGGKK